MARGTTHAARGAAGPGEASDQPAEGASYFGLPAADTQYATSRIVILPVPYGGTVTYGAGTEAGPEAIRAASQQVELFDEEVRREPWRRGIHSAPPVVFQGPDPAPLVEDLCERVRGYLRDGKFVVTLGGEHSISPGPVKAIAEVWPDLTVVQFDAHSDLRDSYLGLRDNHACAGARMREYARLVQIGIRSQSPEERARIDAGEVRAVFAWEMQDGDWAPRVLAMIPPGSPLYVTMDLDYFDPSIMPATGTPEPGGGLWHPTMRFLRRLTEHARIVGFDVMELAPIPGFHAPDFLAARFVYKLLAYAFP